MRLNRLLPFAAAALALVTGCPNNAATGALKVEVVYEAGVVSKCVKVIATDGVVQTPLETMPISIVGKPSPVLVGVGGATPLQQPFTVQALGFTDEGCTRRSNEESTVEQATFARPPLTITLVLRPQNQGQVDGGGDGGADDAGTTDAGATDAGDTDSGVPDAGVVDAGLDLDMDGVPQPADCNDNNPMIRPGIPEVCNNNNVDDNCNGLADCAEGSCDGGTCTNAGICTNGMCMTPNEVCNDGVDNNGNMLVDCAEPSCARQACNDSNLCTTGELCGGADGGATDGGCVGPTIQCTTPPLCHAPVGVCQADGGQCAYTPLNSGSCNDNRACTTSDTCSSGVCTGTPVPCMTTNVCLSTMGTCQEPGATCAFTPLVTGPCDDGLNCTVNDTCDGDGGCTGMTVNCAEPSQCHQWNSTCQANGTCNFVPRATCDAGMATPGSCNPAFMCIPPATNVFPYTPSTFTEAQLPSAAASGFTISCNTVINTAGTTPAVVDGGCVTLPPFAILPATDGGQETLLLKVSSLGVNSGQTLTFIGPRPVILAVLGNATIDGTVLANSGQAPATVCGNGGAGTGKEGGGGGGFGRDGGAGGQSDMGTFGQGGIQNGTPSIDPIRGGCAGGIGAVALGGAGGGALQLSVAGTLNVNATAIIAAPGFGGIAAATTDRGGGGGGSGGALLLEANTLNTASGAWLTANGGGGGSGEDMGAGTSGNAGNINSATPAAGGIGNSNGGNGGAGGAGTTNAQNGVNTGSNDGAGGAGGAVGRIRLRAPSCSGVNGGTNFSPPRAGGC